MGRRRPGRVATFPFPPASSLSYDGRGGIATAGGCPMSRTIAPLAVLSWRPRPPPPPRRRRARRRRQWPPATSSPARSGPRPGSCPASTSARSRLPTFTSPPSAGCTTPPAGRARTVLLRDLKAAKSEAERIELLKRARAEVHGGPRTGRRPRPGGRRLGVHRRPRPAHDAACPTPWPTGPRRATFSGSTSTGRPRRSAGRVTGPAGAASLADDGDGTGVPPAPVPGSGRQARHARPRRPACGPGTSSARSTASRPTSIRRPRRSPACTAPARTRPSRASTT